MDLGAPFFCIRIYLCTSYRILEKDSYYYNMEEGIYEGENPFRTL